MKLLFRSFGNKHKLCGDSLPFSAYRTGLLRLNRGEVKGIGGPYPLDRQTHDYKGCY